MRLPVAPSVQSSLHNRLKYKRTRMNSSMERRFSVLSQFREVVLRIAEGLVLELRPLGTLYAGRNLMLLPIVADGSSLLFLTIRATLVRDRKTAPATPVFRSSDKPLSATSIVLLPGRSLRADSFRASVQRNPVNTPAAVRRIPPSLVDHLRQIVCGKFRVPVDSRWRRQPRTPSSGSPQLRK